MLLLLFIMLHLCFTCCILIIISFSVALGRLFSLHLSSNLHVLRCLIIWVLQWELCASFEQLQSKLQSIFSTINPPVAWILASFHRKLRCPLLMIEGSTEDVGWRGCQKRTVQSAACFSSPGWSRWHAGHMLMLLSFCIFAAQLWRLLAMRRLFTTTTQAALGSSFSWTSVKKETFREEEL